MNEQRYSAHLSVLLLLSLAPAAPYAAEGAGFDEEILVVAPTPGGSGTLPADKLPFTVQAADDDALERAQTLDLTDFMNTHLASVNINSAQNNPLQPDIQYRGFAASPLLGLAQGIAVYQNGARINEPLGDAVNWDLIAESAVHRIALIGGSNPLFGLNTLGGALTVEMKNGFNFTTTQGEAAGGAWSRVNSHIESGANNGRFGFYLNASWFSEDGWRDLSPSEALNLYGALSFRGEASEVDVSLAWGDSELIGNGAAPVGLLAVDRDAVFTAPDITENELVMFTFNGRHSIGESTNATLNGFYRDSETASFNGDGSELVRCSLGAGDFLLEELEEDDLETLGFDDDDVCADNVFAAADPTALEAALNAARPPGVSAFNLDDLSGDLSGSGILSDEAINNRSQRRQTSYGADLQLTLRQLLWSRSNYFVAGVGYFTGRARFESVTELARLDPITRSTRGLGVGTFIDDEATRVRTSSETWSLYFMDTLDLGERVALTVGGRYNNTAVQLRDRSMVRPELNGDHRFRRFNPTVGATFDVRDDTNLYASYSESSRAPTPIELACNDEVFEIARANAVAAGDDPDDVNFECRLPNAFLADPPLEAVVARTFEVGVRGDVGSLRHRLGYFHTDSDNDIIFQTTGRGTGLFANVDKTRRQGFESAFAASWHALDWALAYSYIVATFEDNFMVQSPNHPFANEDGELLVRPGDRIPGIPAHQFKFSSDYEFPWRLRAGFEVSYNSGQYLRGDEANRLGRIDGYALVNLRGSYAVTQRIEAFARITNLFDTDYENFGLLGEAPDDVLPQLTDQRPLFLGAGAPRAGWVGLRIRL